MKQHRSRRIVFVWCLTSILLVIRLLHNERVLLLWASSNKYDSTRNYETLLVPSATKIISPSLPVPGEQDNIDEELIKQRLQQSKQQDTRSNENNNNISEEDNPLSHFYMHIPKTAGYYAFQTLMAMINQEKIWDGLPREDRFRICNIGGGALVNRPKEYRGRKCTMIMSEKPYNSFSKHSYTIIRNPIEQTLSQYFHCAESTDHRRSHMMPSLDTWMEYWMYYDDVGIENVTAINTFGCMYNPVNMQSHYTDFKPQNIARIQQQFTVIGPMDELDKTLCVIFIHYTKRVPHVCVCTTKEKSNRSREQRRQHQASHGVVHHGRSYNMTKHQNWLIRQSVEKDMILYEYVKALFRCQVVVVEQEYNITLCEQIKVETSP